MALLCWARLLVGRVRFARWSGSLGLAGAKAKPADLVAARSSADYVAWAARQLPFETKCLPRAMALSWILRRDSIPHAVVFAVRPMQGRGSVDDLHAWVEVGRETVLGELPGPWIKTLRLGDAGREPDQ